MKKKTRKKITLAIRVSQLIRIRTSATRALMITATIALTAVVCSLFLHGHALQHAHEMKMLQTVGDRTARQFLAMLSSGLCWVAYGAMHANVTLILPNVAAVCVASYSLYTFQRYSGKFEKRDYAVAAALAAAAALGLLIGARFIVGIVAAGLGTLLALTPLVQALPVIERRSTVGIPVPPVLIQRVAVASAALWTLYGMAVLGDAFVSLPNLLGTGAAALLVYATAKYSGRQAPMPPPMGGGRGGGGAGRGGGGQGRGSAAGGSYGGSYGAGGGEEDDMGDSDGAENEEGSDLEAGSLGKAAAAPPPPTTADFLTLSPPTVSADRVGKLIDVS